MLTLGFTLAILVGGAIDLPDSSTSVNPKTFLDSFFIQAIAEDSCGKLYSWNEIENSIVVAVDSLSYSPSKYVNKTSKAFLNWALEESWYDYKHIYLSDKAKRKESAVKINQCLLNAHFDKMHIINHDINSYMKAVDSAISNIEKCDLNVFGCVYENLTVMRDGDSYMTIRNTLKRLDSKPVSNKPTKRQK